MAHAVLALVLPLLALGGKANVATAIDFEVRAGVIPLVPNQRSQAGVMAIATPKAGVQYHTRSTDAQLRYEPRLTFQYPNPADVVRPLYVHQLTSLYRSLLDRRTQFSASAQGLLGQSSYASSVEYFDPGSGALTTRFTQFYSLRGDAQLSYRTGRRNAVGTGVTAGYRGPLDANGPGGGLAQTTNVSLRAFDELIITRRQRLSITARSTYIDTDQTRNPTSSDLVNSGAVLNWTYAYSRRSSLGLTAGGEASYRLASSNLALIPAVFVSHNHALRGWETSWQSQFRLGVRGFLDTINSTYPIQGFVDWNVTAVVNRQWSSGWSLFGSTTLSDTPLVPPRYESYAALTVPVRVTLSPFAQLRFGLRSTLRASHLKAPTAVVPQTELSGFVGFVGNWGTDRTRGAWLR